MYFHCWEGLFSELVELLNCPFEKQLNQELSLGKTYTKCLLSPSAISELMNDWRYDLLMNEYLTPQSPRTYCEIHGDIWVRIKKDTVGPQGIEP